MLLVSLPWTLDGLMIYLTDTYISFVFLFSINQTLNPKREQLLPLYSLCPRSHQFQDLFPGYLCISCSAYGSIAFNICFAVLGSTKPRAAASAREYRSPLASTMLKGSNWSTSASKASSMVSS